MIERDYEEMRMRVKDQMDCKKRIIGRKKKRKITKRKNAEKIKRREK